MKPVVVIRNPILPEWQSCKTITRNLSKAYQLIGEEISLRFFDLPHQHTLLDFYCLAKQVKAESPGTVVWLEHWPSPALFLKALDKVYAGEKSRPQLVFHIYGDYVLQCRDWAASEEILRNFSVRFLSASDKQKQLVAQFKNGSEQLIGICPFPVDPVEFSFIQEKRQLMRKQLGLKSDELLMIYSGRISFQKNIFHSFHAIREFTKLSSTKLKFILAGPMDDLGMPYLGKSGPLGVFHGQFDKFKRQYPELFESLNFSAIGDLEQAELRNLYCAADTLINLSTHNDEDFGMAPAEALCCGLPMILSHWGGFYNFSKVSSEAVGLVDIKIENKRFVPSCSSAVKKLMTLPVLDEVKREELAKNAQGQLGIAAISKLLLYELSLKGKFEGLSDQFFRLLASFESIPSGPFKSSTGSLNDLYFEIYENYRGGA
jgi:glycosyltransferase involved in cell wall biosynthesis